MSTDIFRERNTESPLFYMIFPQSGRSGLTPTLMARPCTVMVASPPAGALVSLVLISPNATVLTVTL